MTAARPRALVVDDERPARAKIVRLLEADGRFEVLGEAVDGLTALRDVERLEPDLVLLDVEMPGLDGFALLEALGAERACAVILSTAHDQHALRAFDAHAVDYLLKPYDAERFGRALDKATAQLGNRAPSGARDPLVLRTEGGWQAVDQATIVRVAAEDKHVRITTRDATLVARTSLRAVEARLDAGRFIRVHRSDIVRLDAVARMEAWEHGDGILVLCDGSTVVLSRTFRPAFVQRFTRRGAPAP